MKFKHIYLAIFLLLAPPANAYDLVVIAEDNPPFSFIENGKAAGFITDIFLQMSRRADIPITNDDIIIQPWARAYSDLQTHDNIILYPTARIAEREQLFQWIGPIMTVDHVMLTLKDTDMDLSDIKKCTENSIIGVLREDVNEQVLIRNGADPSRLKKLNSLEQGIKMLVAGRIDGMPYNGTVLFHTIRKLGFDVDDFKTIGVLSSFDLHYAASKHMDPAIVKKLQGAIEELKADGTVDDTILRYE